MRKLSVAVVVLFLAVWVGGVVTQASDKDKKPLSDIIILLDIKAAVERISQSLDQQTVILCALFVKEDTLAYPLCKAVDEIHSRALEEILKRKVGRVFK